MAEANETTTRRPRRAVKEESADAEAVLKPATQEVQDEPVVAGETPTQGPEEVQIVEGKVFSDLAATYIRDFGEEQYDKRYEAGQKAKDRAATRKEYSDMPFMDGWLDAREGKPKHHRKVRQTRHGLAAEQEG